MKIITNKTEININDIYVYVCVPASGKTYLTTISNNFIDLDRIRSNYKYNRPEDFPIEEHEATKGIKKEELRKDAIVLSAKLIQEALKEQKIILMAPSPDLVEYINQEQIPYVLVFHNIKDIEVIKERMISRGNKERFIEKNCNIDIANKYYQEDLEDQKPNYKIELENNEYLSDIPSIKRLIK